MPDNNKAIDYGKVAVETGKSILDYGKAATEKAKTFLEVFNPQQQNKTSNNIKINKIIFYCCLRPSELGMNVSIDQYFDWYIDGKRALALEGVYDEIRTEMISQNTLVTSELRTSKQNFYKEFENMLSVEDALIIYMGHGVISEPFGIIATTDEDSPKITPSQISTLLNSEKCKASVLMLIACNSFYTVKKKFSRIKEQNKNKKITVITMDSGSSKLTKVRYFGQTIAMMLDALSGYYTTEFKIKKDENNKNDPEASLVRSIISKAKMNIKESIKYANRFYEGLGIDDRLILHTTEDADKYLFD